MRLHRDVHRARRARVWAVLLVGAAACGSQTVTAPAPEPLRFRAVTFNTGTSPGQRHDALPDDGYTSAHAAISDHWYGDGLAWAPAIEDVRRFLATVDADVVAFQEIFYSGDCPGIPEAFHTGWACESWRPGAPTVAQIVAGRDYQVACHTGRPDKCAAVKRSFGTFRGCDTEFCLDGLVGTRVTGCGGGARVGRGVIDLAAGGTLTVVTVHATSGFSSSDQTCRTRQFDQIFVDLGLGDGPAANGERNLVLGDFNTDPGRAAAIDASARALLRYAGTGTPFAFLTPVGPQAPPTYAGAVNIDHMLSDRVTGACWAAGTTGDHPPVTSITYFDHVPVVCDLAVTAE